MTDRLDWYPKRFDVGDMDGAGTMRLLGRPSIDPLAMLMRETAQNTWDARLPGERPQFVVHARTLLKDQRSALAEMLSDGGTGTKLHDVLERESVPIIEIHDRRTKGLGGPTQPYETPEPGEPNDYCDFVLKTGSPRDTAFGGGTYGFGKTIAYMAGESRTILIHSRSRSGRPQPPESRLIASAIGDRFDLDGRRYTGRQWWGKILAGQIEPMTDDQADNVAAAVFYDLVPEDETGTSIMVIGANLRPSTHELADHCAESILWHLWPKLVSHEGPPPMEIQVLHEGSAIEIPNPAEHPVLKGFVDSLQLVRRSASDPDSEPGFGQRISPITRHQRTIGQLAVTPRPSGPTTPSSDEEPDPHIPFAGAASHVALMRQAELVVTYLEMPPTLADYHECGVFKCEPEVDDAFASAEPPAHDAWEWHAIADKTAKSVVRVALRKIVATFTASADGSESPTTAEGGQRLARSLADRLLDLPAPSPPKPPRPRDRHTRAATQVALIEGVETSRSTDGLGVASISITFDITPTAGEVEVTPTVEVVTGDGTSETVDDHDGFSVELEGSARVAERQRRRLTVRAPASLVLDIGLAAEAVL